MGIALSAAVSGLRAHDQMIDVVGNNLANLSTHGFKSRRILFQDLINRNLVTSAKSADENSGGTNPGLIGSGVQTAAIDTVLTQGGLDATGAQFDFAIEGEGYFVVSDGTRNLYTRVGAFSLDDTGTLVDPSTGYRVLRFGVEGEPLNGAAGFQTPGDNTIKVPFGATIPGQQTQDVSIGGNLPAGASPPVPQVLTSLTALADGGSPAVLTTNLSSLDENSVGYVTGDTIELAGIDFDGTNVSSSLAVDGSTTVGDLVAAIDGLYTGATATLDTNGRIVVTADTPGATDLTLSIFDGLGNTGKTEWNTYNPFVQVGGQNGAAFQNSLEVFDDRGGSHALGLVFRKVSVNAWELNITLDESEGTIIDGVVKNISFNDDGTIREIGGSGDADANIEIQFKDFFTSQRIDLDFGIAGLHDGLSHLSVEGSLTVEQDGYASGVLSDLAISPTGLLQAESSNGQTFPLAQLAIARFRNPKGLAANGSNYFVESPSSGEVQIGQGQNGGRGIVRGGHLETSNVDIALQFTRLIVAQRGFSANARTITVADQLLQELTNLVR